MIYRTECSVTNLHGAHHVCVVQRNIGASADEKLYELRAYFDGKLTVRLMTGTRDECLGQLNGITAKLEAIRGSIDDVIDEAMNAARIKADLAGIGHRLSEQERNIQWLLNRAKVEMDTYPLVTQFPDTIVSPSTKTITDSHTWPPDVTGAEDGEQ